MSKSDLVACFHEGSSWRDEPDFVIDRGTCRRWETDGKGFFIKSGKFFQLLGSFFNPDNVRTGSAAVPFSRIQDKRRESPAHSYPIPSVADHHLRWLNSFM